MRVRIYAARLAVGRPTGVGNSGHTSERISHCNALQLGDLSQCFACLQSLRGIDNR